MVPSVSAPACPTDVWSLTIGRVGADIDGKLTTPWSLDEQVEKCPFYRSEEGLDALCP